MLLLNLDTMYSTWLGILSHLEPGSSHSLQFRVLGAAKIVKRLFGATHSASSYGFGQKWAAVSMILFFSSFAPTGIHYDNTNIKKKERRQFEGHDTPLGYYTDQGL